MLIARAAAAAAAGLLLSVAVDPVGLWWTAPLGVAALSLATWQLSAGRAAVLGFLTGFVWFGVATAWVSRVAFAAWPGLALVEALYVAALAAGLAATSRLPAAPWWQAALWATVETVRSAWPLGGFPWLRLAHTTPDGPVSGLLPLVGVVGTSAAVALAGAAIASVVLALAPRGRPARLARLARLVGASTGLVAVALGAAGAWLLAPSWRSPEQGRAGEDVQVALVQGGIRDESGSYGGAETVLANHIEATERIAARVRDGEIAQPDLVVWPENASDADPFANPEVFSGIAGAVRAVGAPALTGIVVDRDPASRAEGLRWKNRVQAWDATGTPGSFYDKRHGVPFGEYVPFRDLLTPLFPQLAQVPQDMRPGLRRGVIEVPRAVASAPADGVVDEPAPEVLPVGVLICFEVADVGLARDAVADGAQMIAVPTNNATYLGTPQPAQQLAIARTTAMASHRSLLIAATNGVTALVDADGEVRRQLPVETTAVLSADVVPRTDLVPAVAHGLLIDRVVWVMAGLGLLGGVTRTRLRGRHAAAEFQDEAR